MTLKVRAWENNREKIISIDDITGTIKRDAFPVDITQELRDNRVVNLPNTPLLDQEDIYINGQMMTKGSDYDYTISTNVLTFNIGILPKNGHILIKYNYK